MPRAAGERFDRLNSLLEAQAQQPGSLAVCWDKNANGVRAFGLFENSKALFQAMTQSKDKSMLNGYEIVPQNRACKLHLLIGWIGEQDLHHARIKAAVQTLREGCQEIFYECRDGINVHISCGTRKLPHGGLYKHSYHLVSPTICFRESSCGKQLELVKLLYQDPIWFDKVDGRPKCCVDLGIYTKNRPIRLPSCSRFGLEAPMIRINTDPSNSNDPFTASFTDMADPEAWKPFILTEGIEDFIISSESKAA